MFTVSSFDHHGRNAFRQSLKGFNGAYWLNFIPVDNMSVAQSVHAFRKVKRGRKIAQLRHGERDLLDAIRARIELLKRDAFGKGRNGHVLLQRGAALVNKGNDRGVKLMLNGKHGPTLGAVLPPGNRVTENLFVWPVDGVAAHDSFGLM